jgi:SAM-dependent methyltransferase
MTEMPDTSDDRAAAALAEATRDVYERQAARFDAERSRRLTEKAWLDRFLEGLPEGARILDLGCGTGEPIAAYVAGRGFRVTGVDVAAAMLAIARQRSPQSDWRQADMRSLALPERFHGILGWDSFFHLTPEAQRATLPRLARHLLPGGVLLLTVGPAAGTATGRVGDEPVYHASLDPADYAARLGSLGLRVTHFVAEDPACGGRTVLLARQRGS